jgi:hypothetical protein
MSVNSYCIQLLRAAKKQQIAGSKETANCGQQRNSKLRTAKKQQIADSKNGPPEN